MASTAAESERPWHEAFPAPRDGPPASVTREELRGWLEGGGSGGGGDGGGDVLGRDFVLVDVRRNDHQGGTIRGSVNLPAQTLHPSLPSLYALFRTAGIRTVVWYCGSCGGRGTRAAGWFADYVADRGDGGIRSAILAGGIKGWVAAGDKFTALMDGYDAAVWGEIIA